MYLSALVVVFVGLLYRRYKQLNSPTRLPGPRGWPLIGNLFDMPTIFAWETFARWRDQYGDVMGLTVLGQPIVILNSRQAIQELLIKRNSIFSDRPTLTLISKWGGFDWALFMLRYGKEMNLQRRLLMQCIGPGSYRSYEPILKACALTHAANILRDPVGFHDHTRLLAAGMLLRVAYGHHVKDMQDSQVQKMEILTQSVENLGTLGGHPTDIFPSLASLPKWIFGKSLRDNITFLHQFSQQALKVPYAKAKHEIEQKVILHPSMVESLLEMNTDKNGSITYEHQIQAVTGASYSAGFDNLFSTIYSFLLLMMLNPDSQRKAQQCLDQVLHRERLPEFSDRDKLPYLDAILMEVMRWAPSIPLALPHRSTEESIYDGKRIPTGSTIIPNSWMGLHDEADFPNPNAFSPERFLDKDGVKLRSDVPDPRDFLFGYGRRRCPGEQISDIFIWIVIATTLATFTISKPVDENGREIEPDLEYVGGLVSVHAKPFKCNFTPRSATAVELLNNATEHMSV